MSCLPRRMTKECPQAGRCGNRKLWEYKTKESEMQYLDATSKMTE